MAVPPAPQEGDEGNNGVEVCLFDESPEDFSSAVRAISELAAGEPEPTFPDAEVERLSSSITFLREWRFFSYEPKGVSFTYGTRSTSSRDDTHEITLPQFSSASVPQAQVTHLEDGRDTDSSDFILFAGGNVWSLDWCPRLCNKPCSPVNCEYLAPTKVCNFQQANFSSASACDAGFSNPYNTWAGYCPLKNSGNQSFCEGTGYITGYTPVTNPCFSIRSCTTASDCELTTAPTAPAPVPALLCYDCCTFCFDDATCTDKVNKNQTYTKDAECTPCHTAPTASNTPSSGNPSTTPGTSNTPKGSTGAVVVVSGIVLAFSALLF